MLGLDCSSRELVLARLQLLQSTAWTKCIPFNRICAPHEAKFRHGTYHPVTNRRAINH
jgi:hypothetical protein